MAVESRFVVIRRGVEAKTFMDKKSADEYDKMLDMADNLAEVFNDSPIELSDNLREELSIYLAQHRDDILVALLAKKVAKSSPDTAEVKTKEKSATSTKKAKEKPVKLSEAS
jgi:dsDNA-binding SOS-regulon protein